MDKQALNIDRYLKGGMNSSERTGFQNQMKCDLFLAEAVDGFRQDPGALYDLPISSAVKINWWWSLLGFMAVITVFLAIPNQLSQMPELTISKNESVKFRFENVPQQFEAQKPLEIRDFNTSFANSEEISMIEEIFCREFIATDFIDLKSAKPILKIDVPTLKFGEKIIYILDLKVVKTQLQNTPEPKTDLSELTDFTPANFSTTIAYKRARQYEGVFPELKVETYPEKLESGLRYFKSEDYKKALSVFSMLLIEYNLDPNAQFYSTLCHFHLADYNIAEAGFARAEKLAGVSFAPESKWYRTLSLRKLGRTNEAHNLLLEIADGGGHYAERAKVLLEKE